jgi:hypothetical protein
MKNIYSAPEFKLILLTAQDVLTQSFEEPDPDRDPVGNDIW